MTVQAYILFKVSSGSERDVCKKLAELEEVSEANIIFGEYDLIARISVQDLQALEDFLARKIRKIPDVFLTSTMIIAREYRGNVKRRSK